MENVGTAPRRVSVSGLFCARRRKRREGAALEGWRTRGHEGRNGAPLVDPLISGPVGMGGRESEVVGARRCRDRGDEGRGGRVADASLP